eukprot:jgi/Chrzof1/3570/Cz13g00220.t1
MSDPVYFYDASAGGKTDESPASNMDFAESAAAAEDEAVAPSKSSIAMRKKTLVRLGGKRPPLPPHGGNGKYVYLPPGNSMKEPKYSIKDPVYFVDHKE